MGSAKKSKDYSHQKRLFVPLRGLAFVSVEPLVELFEIALSFLSLQIGEGFLRVVNRIYALDNFLSGAKPNGSFELAQNTFVLTCGNLLPLLSRLVPLPDSIVLFRIWI